MKPKKPYVADPVGLLQWYWELAGATIDRASFRKAKRALSSRGTKLVKVTATTSPGGPGEKWIQKRYV